MTSGKLITLEGIEGVGKSSNVQFVAQTLQQMGKSVVVTREPGGTPLAEDIRQILLKEYEETTFSKTELLLLYAGRLQHVESLIKPALAKGEWVVGDRFFDATFAYQGAGRGIENQKIAELNQWTLGDFAPDCTILLDAPVTLAFERIKSHRTFDRIEKEKADFFEKIRQGYLALAKQYPNRIHVVDASRELQDVQQQIYTILQRLD